MQKILGWKAVLFFKSHKLIILGCHGTSCVMIYSVCIFESDVGVLSIYLTLSDCPPI